jgi:hypothetical protein
MIIIRIAEALLAYEAHGKQAAVIFLGEECLRELAAEMAEHGQMPPDEGEFLFTVDERPVRSGDFPPDYIGFRADC